VSWLLPLDRDKKAAREAIVRCYGVPYESELNEQERRGMAFLERAGEVLRDDEGFSAVHWHRNPSR
jgi:hypothetical protein